MRSATVFAALLSTASAAGLSFFGDEPIANQDLKVPGESPLEFCPNDHSQDVVTIDSVDLSPNPPEAYVLPAHALAFLRAPVPFSSLTANPSSGQELIITASGTVSKPILEGAYVNLQVKYGLIRLISTTADLCEQIGNVDLECPIEKGPLAITKSVELPNEIPPVRLLNKTGRESEG